MQARRMFSILRRPAWSRFQLARLYSETNMGEGSDANGLFDIRSKQLEGRSIYMDFGATTPTDFRVTHKMMPFMTDFYGNPHSRSHHYGWETEKAVEKARNQVAQTIGAEAKEIIFMSGATEANNLALQGLANFYGEATKKKHIISTQIEHKCVLNALRHLETQGFTVTYLPVQSNGLLNLEDLQSAIRSDTLAASIMMVNNEIGTVQNMEEIGRILRERKVFFHSDIAQSFGKMPIDVNKLNIDLASISSHKVVKLYQIYGPKGIGALYIRKKPRVKLQALIHGGGQERGFRSGTLAPSLCVGFGEAAQLGLEEMESDHAHVKRLSDMLTENLLKIGKVRVNGDLEKRYPGIMNYSFEYVEGESMIMAIKNIAVSSGSACTSASLEPSYVLRAIGLGPELAHTSIRFGIGRFTTEEEIKVVSDIVTDRVKVLRAMSPFLSDDEETTMDTQWVKTKYS